MKLFSILLLSICLVVAGIAQSMVFPYSHEGKYGLINEENEVLLTPSYHSILWFYNQTNNAYAIYADYDKETDKAPLYGIIDKTGEVIIPAQYRFLNYDGNGYFAYTANASEKTTTIIEISTGKELFELYNTHIEGYNSMLMLTTRDKGLKSIVFKNGTKLDLPNHFQVINFAAPCPQLIYEKNKNLLICDCEGKTKAISQQLFDSLAQDNQPPPPTISLSTEVLLNENEVKKNKIHSLYLEEDVILNPVKDEHKRIVSFVIIDFEKKEYDHLIDLEGNILYDITESSRQYKFSTLNKPGFLVYGLPNQLGLMTALGETLIKEEFSQIIYATFPRRSKHIEKTPPKFFKVSHPLGYIGYANFDGRVYLPKSCHCNE